MVTLQDLKCSFSFSPLVSQDPVLPHTPWTAASVPSPFQTAAVEQQEEARPRPGPGPSITPQTLRGGLEDELVPWTGSCLHRKSASQPTNSWFPAFSTAQCWRAGAPPPSFMKVEIYKLSLKDSDSCCWSSQDVFTKLTNCEHPEEYIYILIIWQKQRHVAANMSFCKNTTNN